MHAPRDFHAPLLCHAKALSSLPLSTIKHPPTRNNTPPSLWTFGHHTLPHRTLTTLFNARLGLYHNCHHTSPSHSLQIPQICLENASHAPSINPMSRSHRKTAMNAKTLPPRHAPPLAYQPQPSSWFQNNQRPHLNHPPTWTTLASVTPSLTPTIAPSSYLHEWNLHPNLFRRQGQPFHTLSLTFQHLRYTSLHRRARHTLCHEQPSLPPWFLPSAATSKPRLLRHHLHHHERHRREPIPLFHYRQNCTFNPRTI